MDQEGSHVKLKRFAPEKTYIVIVPLHRELARRTLMSILKQAGLTVEEFLALRTVSLRPSATEIPLTGQASRG